MASSHEQKAVVSTVSLNQRTGLLEIVHRFSLHDVEHAVRDLGWRDSDILARVGDQQRFARLVTAQFSLTLAHPLPLRLVGQELEGRYLWVYQEVEAAQDLTALTVSSTVLRDLWPNHRHMVNVTVSDELRTLVFTNQVSQQTVPSAAPSP